MKYGIIILAGLFLFACATVPREEKKAANYIEVGTVYQKLQGNSFYMGIGQVELYHYNFWGTLEKTGQKVDIAAAIQADPETGSIVRIATMQSKTRDSENGPPEEYQNSAGVSGPAAYIVGDLKGGMLLTDFQAFPHWIDAVTEMQNTLKKLNPDAATYQYEYVAGPRPNTFVIVGVHPWGFGFGWHWGWRPGWHRHRW